MRCNLNRDERLKFSDVVTAVASLVVTIILLDSVFSAAFVPMLPTGETDIAGILSILVASLIVGYVFAMKIQEESRRGAIGSIVVLSAVVLMFFTLTLFANPLASPAIKESMGNLFSTSGWTNYDWFVALVMEIGI